MELDISGLEHGIPIMFMGQKVVIYMGVVYIAIALLVMLLMSFSLRYFSKKQKRDEKPNVFLVIAESLWKFSGGPTEGIPDKYEKSLHVFAVNLFILLMLINTTALWGINPPAANVFIALGLGLLVGIIIHVLAISAGPAEYFKSFFEPFWIMFPLNLVEVFSQVISISMRLFGNMLAGIVLAELMKMALANANFLILYPIFGGILSLYSDLFIATIQSLIFMTLTISYIKGRLGHLIHEDKNHSKMEMK
ncbi:hypothetical protein AwErysi_04860 [Erysipelotrichaceae bacterium]|nr:hypothetical protein AwErysi_04860 [Erysipelotrichaceae bacterium]